MKTPPMGRLRAVGLSMALGLLALGAAGPPVHGQTAAPVPAEKAPLPPPAAAPPADEAAPIPVEEVARRAAEVPGLLRVLTEPLRPSPQIEAIAIRLPEVRGEIDRDLAAAEILLRGQPTLDALQSQQQLWQRRQLQTTGWLNALTQRATLLQDALNRVAAMRRIWDRTDAAAHAAGAPEPILQQIEGALAEIREAERPLAAQRADALNLQAAVAHEVSRSGTALAQLTQSQQRAIGGVLVRDAAPVWSAEAWARAREGGLPRFRNGLAARWGDVARYATAPATGVTWHVGGLAAIALALIALRRQNRTLASTPEGPPAAAAALERPFSAAVVLALLVVAAPSSPVPLSVRALFEVLALGAVIRQSPLMADRRAALPVYTLWVLFALDNLRDTVAGTPVIEQAMLMLVMLVGIAAVWYTRRRRDLRDLRRTRPAARLRSGVRLAGGLMVAAMAAALVAGALGYMRLARLLASGVLGSGALALTVYAAVHVLSGVTAVALRLEPLARLQMVRNHRDLLERRIRRALALAAIVGWVARSLDYVGLFQPALALASAVLAAPLGRGSIQISLGDILEFVLTLVIAYLASAFIRFALTEDVYPRTGLGRGISYAISSLLNYVIIALGFVLALGALGLDLTKVTVLAGALGVGIGFGLQSVVNNFVSGLILLFERPIHVGDVVEVGNLSGEVVRIGIRASIVRTGNGAEMIVPNAQLVTERVTNWTLSDRTRRIDLAVGVDYASPPEKVVEVLEAVARAHPQIMQIPAPQAVFKAFGDSAVTFELRAWTSRFDRWAKVQTELAAAVHAALQAAGMAIPFPQREVRLLRESPPSAAGSAGDDNQAVVRGGEVLPPDSAQARDQGPGAPPPGGSRPA